MSIGKAMLSKMEKAIKQVIVVDKDTCETQHSGLIIKTTIFVFVVLCCRLQRPFSDM